MLLAWCYTYVVPPWELPAHFMELNIHTMPCAVRGIYYDSCPDDLAGFKSPETERDLTRKHVHEVSLLVLKPVDL